MEFFFPSTTRRAIKKLTPGIWEVIFPSGKAQLLEQNELDWKTEISGPAWDHLGRLSKEQIVAWTRYCLTGNVNSLANKKMGVRIPSMNRSSTVQISYRKQFEFVEDSKHYGKPRKRKRRLQKN